jgi:glyoxylase-like metal-dependent hydrolase (beta-lactamase superfamily II)
MVGGLSIAAASYQSRPRPPIASIQKVQDNLYVILNSDPADPTTFTGGTTAVFVTAQGVVLVDTKNPGYGQAILDQVKSITDKPVTMIINTHTHADHTGSNPEFPATIDIVAHANTKANMMKMELFQGDKAKSLPKRTFTDRMSLLSGKDQIDLYYFGRGHTNGDAFVVFPALRAMHPGDMYSGKRMGIFDLKNGGSILNYPDTLAKAVATIKNVDIVLASHQNTVRTWDDMKEYVGFAREFVSMARAGANAGKSVDEVAKGFRPPEKYKDYYLDPARVKENVQTVYTELNK